MNNGFLKIIYYLILIRQIMANNNILVVVLFLVFPFLMRWPGISFVILLDDANASNRFHSL